MRATKLRSPCLHTPSSYSWPLLRLRTVLVHTWSLNVLFHRPPGSLTGAARVNAFASTLTRQRGEEVDKAGRGVGDVTAGIGLEVDIVGDMRVLRDALKIHVGGNGTMDVGGDYLRLPGEFDSDPGKEGLVIPDGA